jgi:hypothetical protein
VEMRFVVWLRISEGVRENDGGAWGGVLGDIVCNRCSRKQGTEIWRVDRVRVMSLMRSSEVGDGELW